MLISVLEPDRRPEAYKVRVICCYSSIIDLLSTDAIAIDMFDLPVPISVSVEEKRKLISSYAQSYSSLRRSSLMWFEEVPNSILAHDINSQLKKNGVPHSKHSYLIGMLDWFNCDAKTAREAFNSVFIQKRQQWFQKHNMSLLAL